jgi:replication-associated recombination protein RarA
MQTTMKLGPEQSGLNFPMPLSEKYRPRHIRDFAGLGEVKRVLAGLVRAPRPCGLLLVGAPGVGKTSVGMALAEDLPGTLCHISSQKCDVGTLDQLSERFQYYPSRGRWWVSLVDEADQMTEKAQLRCLSLLDSTSWLRPRFGGGFEQGTPPPVIWVFTCNGVGANQTGIPAAFEKRFLSRCIVLKFPPLGVEELAKHLHQVWLRETAERVFSNLPGLQNYEGLQPMPDFRAIAQECYGLSVRDALMKLEVLLLGA